MTDTLDLLRETYDEDTLNLCDHCTRVYPICPALPSAVVFNSKHGIDNVQDCSEFRPLADHGLSEADHD